MYEKRDGNYMLKVIKTFFNFLHFNLLLLIVEMSILRQKIAYNSLYLVYKIIYINILIFIEIWWIDLVFIHTQPIRQTNKSKIAPYFILKTKN